MSSTQRQALPTQPDAAHVSRLVSSIVVNAREADSLRVESKLGVLSGTLDTPEYKALVKRTIRDAMQREWSPEVNENMNSKMKKKNTSKQKLGENGGSSTIKSVKSKETITDSEREDEPEISIQCGVKPDTGADNGEVHKIDGKADSKTSRATSSFTKTLHLGSKRKLSRSLAPQSEPDVDSPDKMPKVTSSSHRIADTKSDSEMSSLEDELPKKKARGKTKSLETGKPRAQSKRSKQSSHGLSRDEETIKRLKSLVVACGVRKQWARELDGLNTSAQITHIRKILSDLGMVGRLSMEQARDIRAQRELAQELGA
ncbi:hypothetical protein BC826DRAFT_55583 [Russula brevipes]|nr:hypothetical protein BC826DRAFT_55583 [Russula brevipes]